jgi:long-chain acyl-CoA synthetase
MTRTGSLLPFRKGIGMVLAQQPATVVPVFIRGTDEALPPDNPRLRFRPLSVTFGTPCHPHELAREGQGETEAARIVAALHDRVAALGDG